MEALRLTALSTASAATVCLSDSQGACFGTLPSLEDVSDDERSDSVISGGVWLLENIRWVFSDRFPFCVWSRGSTTGNFLKDETARMCIYDRGRGETGRRGRCVNIKRAPARNCFFSSGCFFGGEKKKKKKKKREMWLALLRWYYSLRCLRNEA